jgi:hypothetical protein
MSRHPNDPRSADTPEDPSPQLCSSEHGPTRDFQDRAHSPADRRALLAGLGGIAAGVFMAGRAQAGPLNPPAGPVTSTGKTLLDVEPRTAVNATNTPGTANAVFRISQPGSYYLTGNVTGQSGKHGIVIAASDVTLDLNGFTLTGVPGSLDGIINEGTINRVTLRNGTIFRWGVNGATLATATTALDFRAENVAFLDNGAIGLRCDGNILLTDCNASDNGSTGFSLGSNSSVTRCTVIRNSGAGISAAAGVTILDCLAFLNSTVGFGAITGSLIRNCTARQNGLSGIEVSSTCAVLDCVSSRNGTNGISCLSDCLIRGNQCVSNGISSNASGILVSGDDGRIVDNTCVANSDRGITVTTAGNFIARNICSGSATNWSIAVGNVCLVVSAATNTTAISGSAGGAAPGSADPNANFSY